jgi:FMN phosphatase YigB (HAD superfamily)
MMLSVLFDLDDTLINNNADTFTRIYMDLLGKHLQPYISADKMLPQLMEGTRQMVHKTTIMGTLEDTFDKSFYPGIGLDKEVLAPIIDDFYSRVFAELKPETSPMPGAADTVRECLSRGWKVAIATNPLFPMPAIVHRLHWANLDPQENKFSTVTAYESYHYAKPQPAYFAEVAYRIGPIDGPVVMIGNDLKYDILPAVKAGMPAYWFAGSDASLPPEIPEDCACGPIDGILPWLEKIDALPTYPRPFSTSAMLAFLRGGAAAIDAISQNIPDTHWNTRSPESEWCLTEILCHLRDIDREVNLPRINTILQQTQPFIAGIESDHWAEERDYRHQNGRDALREFIAVRQAVIDRLEQALPEDWDRVIRHSIFGPTSLKEMVGFIVSHDNNHIKQIKKQLF